VAWQEVPKKVQQISPQKEIHDNPPIKPLQKTTTNGEAPAKPVLKCPHTGGLSYTIRASRMVLCPPNENSSRRKLRLTSSLEYLVLDNHGTA